MATKTEIAAKLDELKISFPSNATKETLWALLPAPIASEIHRLETEAEEATAAAAKAEAEAKAKADADAKAEADKAAAEAQAKKEAASPRRQAWQQLLANYAKEHPAQYAGMKERGELDKIHDPFTTEVIGIDGKKTLKVWTATDE